MLVNLCAEGPCNISNRTQIAAASEFEQAVANPSLAGVPPARATAVRTGARVKFGQTAQRPGRSAARERVRSVLAQVCAANRPQQQRAGALPHWRASALTSCAPVVLTVSDMAVAPAIEACKAATRESSIVEVGCSGNSSFSTMIEVDKAANGTLKKTFAN